MFVVVADFEERQRPTGRDGQERSKDNANHRYRNAINKMLAFWFCQIHQLNTMYKKYKKNTFYAGFLKKFQGFGIMLSLDNPISLNDYFIFEIRLLWFKCWFVHDLN